MLDRIKASVTGWLGRAGEQPRALSLVSHFLAGILYLIETKFLPLATKSFGQNSVVYSCLRLLSQSVPEPPLKVYKQIKVDKREEQPADFPLVALLKQPNELQTTYEMFELMTLHLAIIGRTAWWKERDNKGQIQQLWPLRPDRVAPIYSVDDTPGQRVMHGASYQLPGTGQFVRIPRADLIWINFCDPAGDSGGLVEGLGPISALAREVSADNIATEFVGSLLANSATPSIILKVKAAIRSEAEASLLKAKFRTEFGGSRRGTPAIVDGDTDITTVGLTLRELEFPDVRSIAESRICAAVGVPAVLVGLKVGLEHSTFSNMAEARAFFTQVTLCNYWRRFEDAVNTQLCPDYGDDIIVEFDLTKVAALAEIRQQQIQPILDAFTKGVATRNEYRQALGMSLLDPEIGDVLVVTGTYTEIPTSPAAKKAVEKKAAEAQPALPPAPVEEPEEDEELPAEEKPKRPAAKFAVDIIQPQPNGKVLPPVPTIPGQESTAGPHPEVFKLPSGASLRRSGGKLGAGAPKPGETEPSVHRIEQDEPPEAYSSKPINGREALEVEIQKKVKELEALEPYRIPERGNKPKLPEQDKLVQELLDLHRKMRDFQSSAVSETKAAAVREAERILGLKSASVWVGLCLPEAVADQIVVSGGEPANKLHMTLAMLDAPQTGRLFDAISSFCLQAKPLEASISGTGRFQTSENGADVFYASVDCGELPEFRESLVEWLEKAGLELNKEHGFSPHITLAYLQPDEDLPVERIVPQDVRFGVLSVSVDRGARRDFALCGCCAPEILEEGLKFAVVSEGGFPFPGQPLLSDRESALKIAADIGAEAVEIRGISGSEISEGMELVSASS